MTDDGHLLRQFARQGCEASFQELVKRHLGLVYATALRKLAGDTHMAKDVAQAVFCNLAKKAGGLPSRIVLAGWLYRCACFKAAEVIRKESRRRERERIALRMHGASEDTGTERTWDLLDLAMADLSRRDRDVLLLRFFEKEGLRSVGTKLGISQEAAQKRVARALERLKRQLGRYGVTGSIVGLVSSVSGPSAVAIPSGLATTISSGALANGLAFSLTNLTLWNIMTMTKLKVATIGAVAVLGLGTPLLVQNQTIQGLRQERQIDQDRQAHLLGEWQRLSNQLAQAREANAISSDQFAELLRLRNEVAGLRKLPGELEALKQQNAQLQVQAEQARVRNQEPIEEFLPSRGWQDYGLSTPNASALTFLWASKEGNVPRYAAAMGKSSLEIDETGWRNELLEVAGLTMTHQEPLGGEEVLVSLDYRLHSGTIEKGALALKRRDDEWVVSRIMGFPIRLTVSSVDE